MALALISSSHRVEELYDAVEDSLIYRLGLLRTPRQHVQVRGREKARFEALLPHNSAESPDLILSINELHAVEDLKSYLAETKDTLAPGGLFLAVFFGGASLSELREAFCEVDLRMRGKVSPHIFPMVDLKDLAHGLQSVGFESPVTDIERFCAKDVPLMDAFETLRLLGERNVLKSRARGLFGRDYFDMMATMYPTIDLSCELVYAVGWR